MTTQPTASEAPIRRQPRLTDKPGACEYLSISKRHLDRLVYEKRIAYVKVGGRVRFDYADLDRYIKANRTEAAS